VASSGVGSIAIKARKQMTFGAWPIVWLAQARDQHIDARRVLKSGIDPMTQRKTQAVVVDESVTIFETVALAWHAHWKADKNPDYAMDVMTRLTRDIFPAIGQLPVDGITARQIVAVIKKIEERGALEIAHRSLSNIGQVYRYAVAHGLATRNPAADFRASDIIRPTPVVNMARVEAEELPKLLRKIENYEGFPVTRLAMKLMALTFVRTSELIGARWEEFDFKAKMWTIPPDRMKTVKGAVGTLRPVFPGSFRRG
jgi:integrase